MAMEAQVVGNLVNRLRVIDWVTQHPEVRDEKVVAPLVVLGLPRTGTTRMSRLLGCDPNRRAAHGLGGAEPRAPARDRRPSRPIRASRRPAPRPRCSTCSIPT